ncbi:MAG TPA: GNAT family N-acetyltransferase [Fimbriimonadaceae bacterium]|nr:GNAT family N-acetyltransferase [Fimbriimonadaceae bacterium]
MDTEEPRQSSTVPLTTPRPARQREGPIVRRASLEDALAIIEIEHQAMQSGFAHFGSSRTPIETMSASIQSRYPIFVVEVGDVVGYAKSSPWKYREGYFWTTEIGCYLLPDWQGKGLGKALYRSLLPALEEAGFRTIVAGIALPNPASVALHESFGLEHIGTFARNGFKHGEWRDVGYWALNLGEGPPEGTI